MHTIRISLLFLILPFFAQSQENLTGLWKLKDKESVVGPDYDNGVPKVIKIDQFDNTIKLELTSANGAKDTTLKEILTLDGIQKESTTATQRKKMENFVWDNTKNYWIWQTTMSAKNDFSKQEVSINGTFQLTANGDELTLVKKYVGANTPGGNQDYTMQAVYEKTTPERIARDTATGNGVSFVAGLTWDQIVEKAEKENKYIFVDCYATWCVPCKKMDQQIYPLSIVGEVANKDFIAVKLQMDTAKKDDENVRMTYPLARKFEKDFKISALPTYLFFDPSGQAVHKAVGGYVAGDFIKLLKDSKNPSVQMYTLARRGIAGELSYSQMAEIATKLSMFKEKDLAKKIARKYFEDYLFKLNEGELFTKENIKFLNGFWSVVNTSDRIFKILLTKPQFLDSLSGFPGNSKNVSDYLISKEDIEPSLQTARTENTNPDWTSIQKNIEKKYGKERAFRNVVNSKVNWYRLKKDWPLFCKNLVLQVGTWGDLKSAGWLNLNGAACDIFEHSTDKKQMETALKWCEISIQNQLKDTALLHDQYIPNRNIPWAALLDTYASILYKMGRKKEAIAYYEQKVLAKEPDHPDYKAIYQKMKSGLPTWGPENN